MFLEPLEDRTLPSAGWAIATSGSGTVNTIPQISQPDANGDIYATGYFNGTVTFGTGPAAPTLTATATNTSFVAKIDPNGNVLWAKQFGGLSAGSWTGIATDASGDVYLSGDFDGTQNFGGIPLASSGPNATGYICKVAPDGTFQWAHAFPAYQTSATYSEALAVDTSGNAYVSWSVNQPNGTSAFLSKYDTLGNSLWTQQLTNNVANTRVSIWSVTTDASGDVYLSFSGGSPNTNVLASYAGSDGHLNWSQATPSISASEAIYQDPTSGQRWLYASFSNNTVEKFDAGTGTDPGTGAAVSWSEPFSARSIAVDASGNVYLATNVSGGTVDFDPGPGVAAVTAPTTDFCVLKLDPSGNFLSVYDFAGGPNTNGNLFTVAVDASGNIYTGGQFTGTMNFDTGDPQPVQRSSNGGNRSLFVAKSAQDTGMIYGRAFNDLNGNGSLDPGSLEQGMAGLTVTLNNGATATTDSQGYYHFADVAPGTYTVTQQAPNGYTPNPASFTVSVSAGLASELGSFADFTPNKTRTYSNTTAVSTSKGKPNAISSLTVPDSYTVLGMTLTLNVSNAKDNTLSIFLTGPNGTKISLGSTNQNGTLTFQVPDFDYTLVKGPWKLEVDGLAGGTLKNWSLSIDGTLS